MWKPTAHKPEAIERFRDAARRGRDRRGRLPRALPDQPGRRRRDPREVDRGAARDARGRGARSRPSAVIFHVGSHLGAGFDASLERRRRGARRGPRRLRRRARGSRWRTRPGPAGRSAARSASSRRSSTRSTATRGSGICLDSCHLFASGYDVSDPGAVDALVAEVDETIGLDRLRRAARQRQRDPARLEPRPAREHPRGRDRRGARRLPRPPGLPGARRLHGGRRAPATASDANELKKLRELHARWTVVTACDAEAPGGVWRT